jgi:hypothetical protein
MTLPDAPGKQSWSEKYKAKLQGAREEVKRYQVIKDQLNTAMQQARRNQYALDVLNQINELQVYSPKLLLLLEKYDKAPASNREPVKKELMEFLKSFDQLRANFETVFSKTRFMANPPGYIMDQNQHEHLANGTSNSDWMFVYELAMNKKVQDWLSQY